MASVERLASGLWQARWREPDGTQRKRSFPRKGDADRFLATVEADKVRGSYINLSDRTTVADYARAWAANRPHRPTTARRVASQIEIHIAATRLGGRRLSQVLPSEVQGWAADRATVLAPSSLANLVGLLRSIFAAAVLDRIVASNPVVRLSLPRRTSERIVPLTVAQVQALADAVVPWARAMVITQAGLGLRAGELLALRADDIDFLRRAVRVSHQLSPKTLQRVEPKTPRSRRTVPLPAVVAEALAAHMAAWPPLDDGTIFHSHGRVWRHARHWDAIAKGVAAAALPAGTSSHDLRHHYASVLLAAGESVVAVAERLGHESAGLVLSTYGHLMPDSEDRTRRAVDEAWSSLESASSRAPGVPRDASDTR